MQFNGKRNVGCQGKGIFLTRNIESLPTYDSQTLVAQRYIHKPSLLDGQKLDLRLYVLVTGCDPQRILLHKEGQERLATEEYTATQGKTQQRPMMHLTHNPALPCFDSMAL